VHSLTRMFRLQHNDDLSCTCCRGCAEENFGVDECPWFNTRECCQSSAGVDDFLAHICDAQLSFLLAYFNVVDDALLEVLQLI